MGADRSSVPSTKVPSSLVKHRPPTLRSHGAVAVVLPSRPTTSPSSHAEYILKMRCIFVSFQTAADSSSGFKCAFRGKGRGVETGATGEPMSAPSYLIPKESTVAEVSDGVCCKQASPPDPTNQVLVGDCTPRRG